MKRALSVIVLTLLIGVCGFAQDRVITFEQLPINSQSTITQHFDKTSISYIKMEKEGAGLEYEVYFTNGAKLEFSKNGEFKKVDCGLQQVPDGLVPEPVKTYVKKNFPQAFITQWEKKRNGWKAELNNDLELLFNNQYQFTNIED